MDRRDFLKGLLAAGVATAIAGPAADVLAGTNGPDYSAMLHVECKVTNYGADDMGNGWVRVWKTFIPSNDRTVHIAVKEPNKSDVVFSSGGGECLYQDSEYTASCLIKVHTDNDTSQFCNPQLTKEIPWFTLEKGGQPTAHNLLLNTAEYSSL
ncbi:MAG: twin-arginine translocation signal domain-containing protein [Chloroflexi bacterium]|nr:twin-arginine translocation signal domain-containing protein [Chloroflexota bacterium]